MHTTATTPALSRRLAALVLATAVSVVTLTGCELATEKSAKVRDKGSAKVVDGKKDLEKVAAEEATSETATLGDTVVVGDWEVKVTEVNLNADSTIARANMFNDKAKGRFVLVTWKATYTGAERTADAWGDLRWSFTTTDNKVHDEASAVTPADNQSWPTEARRGGTVEGQSVFDLIPAKTSGGLLTVEGYDDSFDTVYADFTVN